MPLFLPSAPRFPGCLSAAIGNLEKNISPISRTRPSRNHRRSQDPSYCMYPAAACQRATTAMRLRERRSGRRRCATIPSSHKYYPPPFAARYQTNTPLPAPGQGTEVILHSALHAINAGRTDLLSVHYNMMSPLVCGRRTCQCNSDNGLHREPRHPPPQPPVSSHRDARLRVPRLNIRYPRHR